MGDGGNRSPPAHQEADGAFAFDLVEPEMLGQRGDRGARAFQRGDRIALGRAPEARDIDAAFRQPGAQAEVTDEGCERDCAQPPGQPMPEPPVGAIGPDVAQRRKERIGPRIPGPGGAFLHLDHATWIFQGGRVVRRCSPIQVGRLKIGPLDGIVAPAARMVRHEAFRGLGVIEDVRLVGAAVDGRAAEFGEADRFRLRYPCRRCRGLDAARPVIMPVRPPGAQVFGAEDPGLAVRAIGDRGPALRGPIRVGGIEPFEAFATGNVGLQIEAIMDRGPVSLRIQMIEAIAPVGQRQVIVDADEVDVLVRPERIEMEIDISAAIARLMPEIFRPVGGIADLRLRPENGADIGCQRAEGRDGWVGIGTRSDRGQPAHLRSDQKTVHAARCRAEMGVM